VNFKQFRVNARPSPGESPEAAARRARYHLFTELLAEDDALLTAHHQDDQAETVLLQLLRGTGPRGLAAMPTSTRLGKGWLWRPLLETKRADILAYAHSHRLLWVEDSSNSDRSLKRNYIRHEILPRLSECWPSATQSLARSARWCAETAELLDAQADEDLAKATTADPACLTLPGLLSLTEERQRNALRRWFRRQRLPSPGSCHLQRILHDALATGRERQPLIHWRGVEVRRYRDRLYALAPQPTLDLSQIIPWTAAPSPLFIKGVGVLSLGLARGTGLRPSLLDSQPLTVRFRQGGERFRPQGRYHSQELKKLLQEAAIPPWERNHTPLLYLGDQLAAVATVGIAAELSVGLEETGLVLEWQKRVSSDNLSD
jgi:tRNA(Ile)-lysidine synthase